MRTPSRSNFLVFYTTFGNIWSNDKFVPTLKGWCPHPSLWPGNPRSTTVIQTEVCCTIRWYLVSTTLLAKAIQKDHPSWR